MITLKLVLDGGTYCNRAHAVLCKESLEYYFGPLPHKIKVTVSRKQFKGSYRACWSGNVIDFGGICHGMHSFVRRFLQRRLGGRAQRIYFRIDPV